MRYWYDTEFVDTGTIIDLISIGIVAEDGREYYAISTEFDPSNASDWVKENVLIYLPPREVGTQWKSRAEIKADLLAFCDGYQYGRPEFWGYYSAYDHVALCQLFGTMMDLPTGWPMYTRDIKQWCDQLGNPVLPKQEAGEHHALADARWTRKAWEFLNHRENGSADWTYKQPLTCGYDPAIHGNKEWPHPGPFPGK